MFAFVRPRTEDKRTQSEILHSCSFERCCVSVINERKYENECFVYQYFVGYFAVVMNAFVALKAFIVLID